MSIGVFESDPEFILWRMQITWQFINWFRKVVPPTVFICLLAGKVPSPTAFFFFYSHCGNMLSL